MAKQSRRVFFGLGVMLMAAFVLGGCGQKEAVNAAPKITITKAWMRIPPGGRDISAAYLVITNEGGADTLLSVSSPLADDVQMHISKREDGMMSMEHEETVPIAAHAKTIYAPGGRHLMVFGVDAGLKAGDMVPFTLTFARAGKITTQALATNTPPQS